MTSSAQVRQQLPRWFSLSSASLVVLLVAVSLFSTSSVSASSVTPTFAAGNATCTQLDYGDFTLKVDPPKSGVYMLDGKYKVTVSTKDGIYFDWTSERGIDAVLVKGGSNTNVYQYDPESMGDKGLHSLINPKNNKPYALSHISFCYDNEQPTATNTPVPPTATATKTPVPPTATATNTPVPPTATATKTPVPPTATATNTPVPPTATATNTPVPPTATATNTPVPPTATATNTPVPPTATATNTPVPPTATATNTPVPPTATATNTPVPPTATATNTPVPPTATATNTPVPPTATATNTPVPPTATATNTPVPPTATATNTPVPPTATATNTPPPPANGSISGVVWFDGDLDGNRSFEESGLGDLQVYLYLDDGDNITGTDVDGDGFISREELDADDQVVAVATTQYSDTDISVWGQYRFDNLAPGRYWVWNDNTFRGMETTPNPYSIITVDGGQHIPDVNFGLYFGS